jgi:hypothetical protein
LVRSTAIAPRDARWQRERVGEAVIRDVAIRAAPVRCPHKWTPNHAPALSFNAPDHGSVVAMSRSADPANHTPHPDPSAPNFGPCGPSGRNTRSSDFRRTRWAAAGRYRNGTIMG